MRDRIDANGGALWAGNCRTLVLATLRCGEWERSSTTMLHGAMARRVVNTPAENTDAVRALLERSRRVSF